MIVDGMTAHEAVRVSIDSCESSLRSVERRIADKLKEVTQLGVDIEALEGQQRRLGQQLEGLRLAWRRVALQDADLLAQVTGPAPRDTDNH